MYWQRIQAHNSIVTCAVFSPKPQLLLDNLQQYQQQHSSSSKQYDGVHVFVSAAGCDGLIKVFVNKLSGKE